jgi:hypothetical protein
MDHRRRHHGHRSFPSGRAEVELFTAWERELTDDPAASSAAPDPEPAGDRPSAAPLWWALCVATVFLLVALLL